MQIIRLFIKNFKFIRQMEIKEIEKALILVGKNNTGKTAVLDAVRAVTGDYQVSTEDFNRQKQRIEITVTLKISKEDLSMLYQHKRVSAYRRYSVWYEEFCKRLPAYQGGCMTFTYTVNNVKKECYNDGYTKNNKYIKEVLPEVYYIDTDRRVEQMQKDLLAVKEDEQLKQMRLGVCLFEESKQCSRCFQCIGLINQKKPQELTVFETAKLLEYKLCQINLLDFAKRVNTCFHKNGGFDEIQYKMRCNVGKMCEIDALAYNKTRKTSVSVERMGEGMRSIYMLSLLEAYAQDESRIPSIILVKDPENYLHPQLQKKAGEILYRLSKKNQIMFSTHSPDMIFNFNSHQIRQIVLDQEYYTIMREKTDMNRILDDLGFQAGDLMNVSFVFIVEGKQDRHRLPLLLKKYYSEIYDDQGRLFRVAIITTNSCTNIKTYANLKYINQLYLRDQFLMIRDGDGSDREMLAQQLCRYYETRKEEEGDQLPRVTKKNVLILKYYSFENYFLNPSVMVQIGILKNEEDFYKILLEKWNAYLYKIRSGRHLSEILGFQIKTIEELKSHMEEFKIYMRGHNIFDIFYGPYKEKEQELLSRYIDLAPREDFADILDAIDRFIYFESRKNRVWKEEAK